MARRPAGSKYRYLLADRRSVLREAYGFTVEMEGS
jgi:hypothetical protein